MEKFRDAAALGIYLNIVYPDAIVEIKFKNGIGYIVEMIYHGMQFQFATIEQVHQIQNFIHDSLLRMENIH